MPASTERRVALVTGAGRGIGRAVALRLAREGMAVALNDVATEPLDDAVGAVAAIGVAATGHVADVGEPHSVDRLIDEVVKSHGRLDVLVSNAGAFQFAALMELTSSAFESVLRTNLLGGFHCIQAAARYWIASRQPGRVVVVSSVSAHQARPRHAHYGASKAGLEMLAKVAALELGPYGIAVNCVAPGGPVLTEFVQSVGDEVVLQERARQSVPLGRLGAPEEVAGAVWFLASGDASYMTGAVVMVDGGVTLGRP